MNKIALSLIILLLLGLLVSLGIFSPYNYFKAKNEVKANHFKKICINEEHVWFIAEKKMGEKYGFDVYNISNKNETAPINYFGIKIYNRTMVQSYIKRNGEERYKKYNSELDSLMKHIFYR